MVVVCRTRYRFWSIATNWCVILYNNQSLHTFLLWSNAAVKKNNAPANEDDVAYTTSVVIVMFDITCCIINLSYSLKMNVNTVWGPSRTKALVFGTFNIISSLSLMF